MALLAIGPAWAQREVLATAGVWSAFGGDGASAICEIEGTTGSGTIALDVRGDRPGIVRLRLRSGGEGVGPTSPVRLESAFSDGTTQMLQGAGTADELWFDLGADVLPRWLHGFTAAATGVLRATTGSATWSLDLRGTTPVVDAMQRCIQARSIPEVPPPFRAAAIAVKPNVATELGRPATIPAGYLRRQRLTVDAATGTLEILEDARIGVAMREAMWGSSTDPAFAVGEQAAARFRGAEPLPARIRLVSSTGTLVADEKLGQPLAQIALTRLRGLPTPTFELVIDDHAGFGSFTGLHTTLLQPAISGLDGMVAEVNGRREVLALAATGRRLWQIVPAPSGSTQLILNFECETSFWSSGRNGAADRFVGIYTRYRYESGTWIGKQRRRNEQFCEVEVMPERRLFP